MAGRTPPRNRRKRTVSNLPSVWRNGSILAARGKGSSDLDTHDTAPSSARSGGPGSHGAGSLGGGALRVRAQPASGRVARDHVRARDRPVVAGRNPGVCALLGTGVRSVPPSVRPRAGGRRRARALLPLPREPG